MTVRLTSSQKVRILNSQGIYLVMQEVLLRENKIRRNQEHFWVIGLNNANKILFIELVALGASNRVSVHPPEVFRIAIYKLAAKLILVHNHPSGALKASREDKDLTDRMIKSGNMLNIEVLDHLIITDTAYTSFADENIIEELKQSGRYELVDKEKALLHDMKLEAAKENERRALAKKMKKEGLRDDVIKRVTGLKKAEIGRL